MAVRLLLFYLLLLPAVPSCFAQASSLQRLHIVLNQTKFAPGDTLFFSSHLLDENGKLVTGSLLLDFNLVDNRAHSIYHFLFPVREGIGASHFVFPDSLPAGIYAATFHSRGMLNFDPVPFATHYISFVHKNQVLPSNHAPLQHNSMKKSGGATIILNSKQVKPREKVSGKIDWSQSDSPPQAFTIRVINEQVIGNMSSTEVSSFSTSRFVARKQPYQLRTALERSGRVVWPGTKQPVPDYTQVQFILQHHPARFQTFTLDSGRISVSFPEFSGSDELICLAESKGTPVNVEVIWDEEHVDLPSAPGSRETSEEDAYAQWHNKVRLIHKAYSISDSVVNDRVNRETFENWLEVDQTVRTTDYVIFPTMEEFLTEVVSSVFVRKKKNGKIVRVKLLEPMKAVADPLYIIDGQFTRSTDYFLSLKPADILTLKLLTTPKRLMPLGLMGKNGIIIVKTRAGESAREVIKHYPMNGLQVPVSPVGSISRPRHSAPVFKSTVYWNPLSQANDKGMAEFEFTHTDDLGPFKIVVEGIDLNGQPFRIEETYDAEVPPR